MVSALLNKCLTLLFYRLLNKCLVPYLKRQRLGLKINDTTTGHETHKFGAKSGDTKPIQVEVPQVYKDAEADWGFAKHREQQDNFAVHDGDEHIQRVRHPEERVRHIERERHSGHHEDHESCVQFALVT